MFRCDHTYEYRDTRPYNGGSLTQVFPKRAEDAPSTAIYLKNGKPIPSILFFKETRNLNPAKSSQEISNGVALQSVVYVSSEPEVSSSSIGVDLMKVVMVLGAIAGVYFLMTKSPKEL